MERLRDDMVEQSVDVLVITCPRDLLWLIGLRTPGKPPVHCAIVTTRSEYVTVVTRRLEMSNLNNDVVNRYPFIVEAPYLDGDDAVQVLAEEVRRAVSSTFVATNRRAAPEVCIDAANVAARGWTCCGRR